MSGGSFPVLARPFLDKLLCIHVSPDAPSFPLADFAEYVCGRTGGRIVKKLGDPWIDEAYWDIQVGPHLVVLHYQHYLGVFLCAGNAESEAEVERLLPVATEYVSR
jgi:hypothetical protein